MRRTPTPQVALLLPAPLDADVDGLLADGHFTRAVRLVRERSGTDLLTATRAVRHRQDDQQLP
ncbi:hypothetical protein [Pseudokineococcus marinus]|uniref:Uncharacterized protein n=1 Tax=Pseudokineococcus marinus TaxID=351215 RepID=A0A849BX62_9ACTN|nr:hypothetical protein [Pseudokineococcus marinus]NNH22108.1 hypothetical protein [Pseudokineococcus marinus]NNH22517.1 hypothetical protein [Pseudokineococcus marinus]